MTEAESARLQQLVELTVAAEANVADVDDGVSAESPNRAERAVISEWGPAEQERRAFAVSPHGVLCLHGLDCGKFRAHRGRGISRKDLHARG
jgi:hypothetical protein